MCLTLNTSFKCLLKICVWLLSNIKIQYLINFKTEASLSLLCRVVNVVVVSMNDLDYV